MGAAHTPESLTPAAFYEACQSTLLAVPYETDSHVYWGHVGLVPESTGEHTVVDGTFRLNDYHAFETRDFSPGVPGASQSRYRELLENGTSIFGLTLFGPNGLGDQTYPHLPHYSTFRPSDVAERPGLPTPSLLYPYDLKRFPDALPPLTIEEGHWDELVVVKSTPLRIPINRRRVQHELIAHPGYDPQLWEVYKALGGVSI